ncbi:uncharacterized protein TNCV_4194961 [Trichonephila clavipes]|nr:uncharacterized protein TNCV_4194961 [Trichonephila clavipes]
MDYIGSRDNSKTYLVVVRAIVDLLELLDCSYCMTQSSVLVEQAYRPPSRLERYERKIESISPEICASLNTITTSFVYFSLALDETSDINDTAQLAIFIRGVDSQMNSTEELFELVSLKGTDTGRDIKDAVINCAQSRQIDLKNLVGIATDGAPSMFKNFGNLETKSGSNFNSKFSVHHKIPPVSPLPTPSAMPAATSKRAMEKK